MRRSRDLFAAAGALSALLVGTAGLSACGRPEEPAPPKSTAPATATESAKGTNGAPSVGREVREGDAKVGDIVKESAGGAPREIERGRRPPGPTPTFPPGQRQRPRY